MKPSALRVIGAVGLVTFRELLREKLLYNIVLFAALVFGAGALGAQLLYQHQERVVLDFGVAGLAISCGLIAVLAGSSLLNRELERRTIHVALSRPISRQVFLLGKYFGLAMVIALNWLLLSIALLLLGSLFAIVSGAGVSAVLLSPTLQVSLIFLLLQSLALGSLSLFVSSFSTPSIAVILSFGLYLIGSNLSELRLAAEKIGPGPLATTLKLMAAVLPGFERFAPGARVTYGLPLAVSEGFAIFLYGTLLIAFFLACSGMIIRKKEV